MACALMIYNKFIRYMNIWMIYNKFIHYINIWIYYSRFKNVKHTKSTKTKIDRAMFLSYAKKERNRALSYRSNKRFSRNAKSIDCKCTRESFVNVSLAVRTLYKSVTAWTLELYSLDAGELMSKEILDIAAFPKLERTKALGKWSAAILIVNH